ncbi:hypothetical protein NCAS_0I02740 [Naumovozyma castellii]|uniref:F-box domain-containing protein n=1 Tax=Naumovozyma castellii TaxID=27288 RepID=G0VKA8_NAUCA|nr:hypothetical protein NCAS_0I02740 [Naumovozyma castellii CBS 4309]CCC71942.1 hypothetical protein NCAS_0I02740 [Naumovozyma castellii CBS 4309]
MKHRLSIYDTVDSHFPLAKLPDELVSEIFSHLPQRDRLNLTLLSKKYYPIAIKLIYKRIYLNDSNVVTSDFMNLAINWTLLNIPSNLVEEQSRLIANNKLTKLISTFESNRYILESVEWIRINWDLDSILQKKILSLLCAHGKTLKRLENVTDPSCNDIIAMGQESRHNLLSFDMAPPNPLPELSVSSNYIPNLTKYLTQRMSTNLSYMTLFMDPIKLFNQLYPLKNKLQIIDLKLHWRREFYNLPLTSPNKSIKLRKLSDVFDVRSLKTLTIISWNEVLLPREVDMLKECKEFIYLNDLSLISIRQDVNILVELFSNLKNLKRLKMDFLEDYIPESTNSQIFLSILLNCKKLQFMDLRFENIDLPIINIDETQSKFKLIQKCFCLQCNKTFNNILKNKIFHFDEDYDLKDVNDIAAKDIYKMMRYFSLLPYSKACDNYPSVRTQPMNLEQFTIHANDNLLNYRKSRSQLVKLEKPKRRPVFINLEGEEEEHDDDDDEEDIEMDDIDEFKLPHEPLTKEDIIDCYHAMIHHYKNTYVTFLKGFPELRFLMLNDIPSIIIEEDRERIFEPVFYHNDYTTNLTGWSLTSKKQLSNSDPNGTMARKAIVS